MPTVVLAGGARSTFDSARLRRSLVTRGLGESLADEIVTRVEAALPDDAEIPTAMLDGLVGNTLLAAPVPPAAGPDDASVEALVEAAFEFGAPGIEQAFVAGMLVGESPIARERLLSNPRVVLGMAETVIAGGLVVHPFLVIHHLKAFIQWILCKLGRSAANKVAGEAGKEVAERVWVDAAKNGWKGVLRRLGVLGVEVLTLEVVVVLSERLLEDRSVDSRTKERLRALLGQVRKGAIDPDLGADQIERIMIGD
ncbi:hypothetical protein [Paraliomyxa miuraensis]|uniref:hypothetical protein n=1 Tax=Paraliomyxa miuraensis TaxID=376150 RepID=UPI00225215BD|nr:hypothetical protein [Paraliomyxa miuraensis]MCX4242177.1 hypothetical protein [Paraliomyxa miuraensis]